MKKNIYCITGVDGVGKTSFAKFLCELFGWQYFKKTTDKKIRFGEGENPKFAFRYEELIMFDVYEQFKYTSLITDRGIIDEYVYGKTFNRDIDESLIWEYDKKFANLGGKIIYCYKNIPENIEQENGKINKEILEKVKNYYENDALTRTSCTFVKIDMNSEDLALELAQLLKSEILWN